MNAPALDAIDEATTGARIAMSVNVAKAFWNLVAIADLAGPTRSGPTRMQTIRRLQTQTRCLQRRFPPAVAHRCAGSRQLRSSQPDRADRGAPKGIRIPVCTLKGCCPRPLDDRGNSEPFTGCDSAKHITFNTADWHDDGRGQLPNFGNSVPAPSLTAIS